MKIHWSIWDFVHFFCTYVTLHFKKEDAAFHLWEWQKYKRVFWLANEKKNILLQWLYEYILVQPLWKFFLSYQISKLQMNMFCFPANLLQRIYSSGILTQEQNDIYSKLFIPALFAQLRNWNNLKGHQ